MSQRRAAEIKKHIRFIDNTRFFFIKKAVLNYGNVELLII